MAFAHCVLCNGNGYRYVRHETGYVSKATVICSDCSGSGLVRASTLSVSI